MTNRLMPALCAALVLSGCGSSTESANETSATAEPGAAAPAAKQTDDIADGRVNYKLVAYPGSEIGGEPVRFTTSASIEKVMEWYRDPARRAEGLMVSSERKDDGYLALGTLLKDDGGKSFTLLINSTSSGGTEGKFLRADWLTTGQKL